MNKSKLTNKVVLMSGGFSHLGEVVAGHLVSERCNVYAGFNSTRPIRFSKNITPVKLDVTKTISCRQAVAQIIKNEKKIDVLINLAGVTKAGKFEDSTLDDFDKLLEVNTKGAFRLIKEVLPFMKAQKYGYIVNVSSLSGLVSFPNFSIYSASKFALEAMSFSLRYEVYKDNIHITCVEPGAIESEGNGTKMPHKPIRDIYPLVGKLLPLVKCYDVAAAVGRILKMDNPPANVLVGRDVKLAVFLKRFTPDFLWDVLLKFIWRS